MIISFLTLCVRRFVSSTLSMTNWLWSTPWLPFCPAAWECATFVACTAMQKFKLGQRNSETNERPDFGTRLVYLKNYEQQALVSHGVHSGDSLQHHKNTWSQTCKNGTTNSHTVCVKVANYKLARIRNNAWRFCHQCAISIPQYLPLWSLYGRRVLEPYPVVTISTQSSSDWIAIHFSKIVVLMPLMKVFHHKKISCPTIKG